MMKKFAFTLAVTSILSNTQLAYAYNKQSGIMEGDLAFYHKGVLKGPRLKLKNEYPKIKLGPQPIFSRPQNLQNPKALKKGRKTLGGQRKSTKWNTRMEGRLARWLLRIERRMARKGIPVNPLRQPGVAPPSPAFMQIAKPRQVQREENNIALLNLKLQPVISQEQKGETPPPETKALPSTQLISNIEPDLFEKETQLAKVENLTDTLEALTSNLKSLTGELVFNHDKDNLALQETNLGNFEAISKNAQIGFASLNPYLVSDEESELDDLFVRQATLESLLSGTGKFIEDAHLRLDFQKNHPLTTGSAVNIVLPENEKQETSIPIESVTPRFHNSLSITDFSDLFKDDAETSKPVHPEAQIVIEENLSLDSLSNMFKPLTSVLNDILDKVGNLDLTSLRQLSSEKIDKINEYYSFLENDLTHIQPGFTVQASPLKDLFSEGTNLEDWVHHLKGDIERAINIGLNLDTPDLSSYMLSARVWVNGLISDFNDLMKTAETSKPVQLEEIALPTQEEKLNESLKEDLGVGFLALMPQPPVIIEKVAPDALSNMLKPLKESLDKVGVFDLTLVEQLASEKIKKIKENYPFLEQNLTQIHDDFIVPRNAPVEEKSFDLWFQGVRSAIEKAMTAPLNLEADGLYGNMVTLGVWVGTLIEDFNDLIKTVETSNSPSKDVPLEETFFPIPLIEKTHENGNFEEIKKDLNGGEKDDDGFTLVEKEDDDGFEIL